MGGVPNLNGFQEWPVCDECNTPLDFVLQLYRTDFPDFYFPDNENIFQLFRCPNGCCPAAYSGDHYDHKMFHYYWNVNTDENNDIEIPDSMKSRSLGEEKAQECHFRPKISDDYPDPGDYAGDDWANLEDKYGGDMLEEDRVVTFTDKGLYLFMDTFYVKRATKCGGYPSWTQDTKWPDCGCGSKKEFFFQLAGDEDHGLFLGDGGSINYFVCTKCGEESIESRSDCTQSHRKLSMIQEHRDMSVEAGQ